MLGAINHALQCFLRDTYGAATWDAIAREAGLGFGGFEAMLTYDDSLTDRVVEAASRILSRPRESLLEDMGTYLVSHASFAFLRRLLRFGGVNFADFVNSLEELPERARMVLPELEVPELALTDHGAGHFTLICRSSVAGAEHVIMGLLRSMADDYGALVLLDTLAATPGAISIQVADQAFTAARPFALGRAMA